VPQPLELTDEAFGVEIVALPSQEVVGAEVLVGLVAE
jgi:hypothetical protein